MKCFSDRKAFASGMTTLGVLVLISAPVPAVADLTVIADQGGASALPYYRMLNPQPDSVSEVSSFQPQIDVSEASMLPVQSDLSPGLVESRTIHSPGLQPFFLIGDDDLSRAWLKERGDLLRQMGAVGLVVNVGSAERLADLRQHAHGLEILPAAGDDVASRVGLDHYPVLITATSIEQ